MVPERIPDATDHDRIVRLETMMEDVHAAVVGGDGNEGLVAKVARHDAELAATGRDLAAVRASVPTAAEKRTVITALAAVCVLLAGVAAKALGIDLSAFMHLAL